jgi:cysteinyl-tRNA synthetase
MININGIKMSKSLGNVWWAKDLIAQYGGNTIRWIMICAQYRAPLNISDDTIEAAQKELLKIQTAYKQAVVQMQLNDAKTSDEVTEDMNDFIDALNDDLNTPNAVSVVYEVVKKLNQSLRTRNVDFEAVAKIVNTLEKMLYVLGIKLNKVILTDEDKTLYKEWRAAVKAKDFENADTYRASLQEKGIL